MMFKRAEQMEVAWSKVGAIRRMLEDFPLLLLHDNTRPHTANKINETLQNFKWEVPESQNSSLLDNSPLGMFPLQWIGS
jgi:hypothetical protein